MLRVRDSSAAPPVSRLMTDWNSLLVIGCANGRLRGRQAKRRLCRTRQGLFRPCWRHLYVGIAQRPDHLEPAPLVHGFGHFGSRHPTETDRWLAKKCVGSTPTPHSSTVSCIFGNSSLFSIVGGCPPHFAIVSNTKATLKWSRFCCYSGSFSSDSPSEIGCLKVKGPRL